MAIPGLGLVGSVLGLVEAPVAASMGIGKNTTNVQNFGTTSQYNPNNFQYGNRVGGADDAANRYRFGAEQAQTRQGEQVNYSNALGQRQNSLDSRQGQAGIAGLMDARARGLVPSIAQQQADRQMQQVMAAQGAMAGSARGSAGLALAQQGAANNIANAQGNISGQAQINAAMERQQAEQAAFGAYSGMRAGDFQGQDADSKMAQYQAMLNQQQRAQNDTFSLGMTAQEQAVRQAQLNAGMQQQNMMANSHQATQGQELGRGQNNANREFDYYKQFSGALQGGADSATQQFGTPAPGGGGAPITSGLGFGGTPAPAASGGQGIPPPTGSDDRMKMGLSPLGFGVGGPSPMSGPAPANFEGVGSNGMDPMSALQAHGAVGTQYVGDASGGMASGGLLSDERCKNMAGPPQQRAYTPGQQPLQQQPGPAPLGASQSQAAAGPQQSGPPQLGSYPQNSYPSNQPQRFGGYPQSPYQQPRPFWMQQSPTQAPNANSWGGGGLLSDDRTKLASAYNMGRAHQMEYTNTGERPGGWEFDLPKDLTDQYVNTEKRDRDNGIRQPTSFDRDARPQDPNWRQQWAATPAHHAIKSGIGAAAFGALPMVAKNLGEAQTDPVTAQFAQGASPIQFQYKPGMGPPGERVGVRAQGMLTTPITAPAVTKRPDGLLAIDPQQGLGTALAGVGHLAQKQEETDALMQQLLQRGNGR